MIRCSFRFGLQDAQRLRSLLSAARAELSALSSAKENVRRTYTRTHARCTFLLSAVRSLRAARGDVAQRAPHVARRGGLSPVPAQTWHAHRPAQEVRAAHMRAEDEAAAAAVAARKAAEEEARQRAEAAARIKAEEEASALRKALVTERDEVRAITSAEKYCMSTPSVVTWLLARESAAQ